jgi:glycosyltransferase involved in cell wall biosynthesis
MRILHVIPGLTLERGGPAASVQALARRQAAAGHAVYVLTTDQGARNGERPMPMAEGVSLHRVSVFGPDRIAFAPRFVGICREILRNADVLHAHSIFTHPVHMALREALARGVPAALKPCGQLHRYSLGRSALQKQAYLRLWGGLVRRATSLWVYTSRQEAADSWPWDDSPRVVLPNGIDPEEFAVDRQEARREAERTWPELGTSPYVLFLGRVHPKKRLDLLLEAFLAGAPPSWKLVVAGPDEANLWSNFARRFLQSPDAARRVVRLSTVTGRDKVQLFAGASWFAMPSEHENFGIAALEALAAGTPVLCSPHVDLADEVTAAGWGETLSLDLAAWTNRLASLPVDESPTDARVRGMREWVADRFSWAGLAQSLEHHYRRLIDGRVAPPSSPFLRSS